MNEWMDGWMDGGIRVRVKGPCLPIAFAVGLKCDNDGRGG